MENIEVLERVQKLAPELGVNEDWTRDNFEKIIPALESIYTIEELYSGIDYAKEKGIQLVTPNGTLNPRELVKCVEKSLTKAVNK